MREGLSENFRDKLAFIWPARSCGQFFEKFLGALLLRLNNIQIRDRSQKPQLRR